MLTEKEHNIIKALVEDELNTAKESIIISDAVDPVEKMGQSRKNGSE